VLVPCETVVRELLPVLRARTAQYLYKEHGLSQEKIAGVFGITQAAVSKYLSRENGGLKANAAVSSKQLSTLAKELADSIAEGHMDQRALSSAVCDMCVKLRNEECTFRPGSIASVAH
jgi:predicted transcriptional regulator